MAAGIRFVSGHVVQKVCAGPARQGGRAVGVLQQIEEQPTDECAQ